MHYSPRMNAQMPIHKAPVMPESSSDASSGSTTKTCPKDTRETFTECAARHGWGRAVYRSIMLRLRRRVLLAYVSARRLGAQEYLPHPEYDVRVANHEELLAAARAMPFVLNEAQIESALANGDLCFAAFDKDQMVAFTWRCYSRTLHEPEIWATTEKPFRYGYKAYTLPEYRGQHILNPQFTDHICQSKGYEYATGFIETHNYSSIKSAKRHGNRVVGYAGYLTIFGRVIPFRSPGAKRFGFAFVRDSSAT